MPTTRAPRPLRIILCGFILSLVSTAVVFGQAGWKVTAEKGFTFRYPGEWNFIDLGSDEYGGMKGHLKALSPPGETNFAIVVMLFPGFSIDLKAEKMTYADFMKLVFESFLKDSDLKDLKIEETDAVLQKGKVPAFMVINEKTDAETVKAAMICGDLVGKNAAIIVIIMDLPADGEIGKGYIEKAENILASFTFPK